MLFLIVIPIAFAVSAWRYRRESGRVYLTAIEQLGQLRQLLRSSVAVPADGNFRPELRSTVLEAMEKGMSSSEALGQAAIWLRAARNQGQKAGRLTALWSLRMIGVVVLALIARLYLLENVAAAFFGTDSTDYLLIATGALMLTLGTHLILQFVPKLEIEGNGDIAGLKSWLRNRIGADNGHHLSDDGDLSAIEAEELKCGLSLYAEKIELLDNFWRNRVFSIESKCEAAIEIMPVIELIAFGAFMAGLLVVPLLQYGH